MPEGALTAQNAHPPPAILAAAALALLWSGARGWAQDSGCRLAPAISVATLALTDEGDLLGPDGRLWTAAGAARISGGGQEAERRRLDLVRQFLAEGPFLVSPVAGRPDRWGRMPSVIRRAGSNDDLAVALVRGGVASASPADLPARCGRALVEAEAEARRSSRSDGESMPEPMDAADPAGILRHVGRFAVVEGRVASTSERKTRAYLNFGGAWNEDFTVTISKRSLNRIEASGMRWSSLKGQRVRVRGVVAESGGPVIEINAPEDIERIE